MLVQDHYGGKTPEETLAMFVEALKKKDAKLAAKYYLPWEWEKRVREMEEWINNSYDKVEKFVKAFEGGIIKLRDRVSNSKAIYIYDDIKDKYPYIIYMRINEETNIWKIEKF